MRRWGAVLLLLAAVPFAFPVRAEGEPGARRQDRVRRLVALSRAREVAMGFLKLSLEGNRERYGDLDPARWRRIERIVLEEGEKGADAIAEEVGKAYSGLDDREIEAAIRFAESPAGRKFFSASPAACSETLRLTREMGKRVSSRVRERLEGEGRQPSP
jgi:hypothetical protein